MSVNNKVILTGNLGTDAEVITTNKSEFVVFSLCTQDSYKKEGNWIKKDPVWHAVSVFNPQLMALAKRLKQGERIEVTGELTYLQKERDGVKYQEARVNAYLIEDAPLPAKSEG